MNCRRRPMRPSKTDSEIRRESPRGKDRTNHYGDRHGMEYTSVPNGIQREKNGRVVRWASGEGSGA